MVVSTVLISCSLIRMGVLLIPFRALFATLYDGVKDCKNSLRHLTVFRGSDGDSESEKMLDRHGDCCHRWSRCRCSHLLCLRTRFSLQPTSSCLQGWCRLTTSEDIVHCTRRTGCLRQPLHKSTGTCLVLLVGFGQRCVKCHCCSPAVSWSSCQRAS